MYSPRWCLSTTPHSGTRYVRNTFVDAGYVALSQRKTKYHIDGKTDLIWGHCDRGHENWMDKVEETWPNVRHLLVVRDPMANLATHWKVHAARMSASEVSHTLRHIGNSLDLYRRIQETYIERFDPYIHPVENPIAMLGHWAGIELKEGSTRHSQGDTPIVRAVADRDLDAIFDIVRYSNLMEWFITEHSANIAPLYRDQLGYDFWWYNG